MKRFYKMFGITFLILSLVFMISCGDDDDDDDPTTPTEPTATPTPTATTNGVEYDGYYWYYGGSGLSCDTVCTDNGGCNAAGITYAGSQGSGTACDAILTALGAPADTFDQETDEQDATLFASPAVGCNYDTEDGDRMVLYTGTCDTGFDNIRRACACNL